MPKTSIIRMGYTDLVALGHSFDQLQQISGISRQRDLPVRTLG
ncbi:hypothetical protein X801_03367 [Opisthorchis viverrini]|uniref:Uncharacterized protein n=1 Tax=Opisthorchis viverrini TaxID=6198 RepID=A0A1S8X241_OPIVI|nr:hypothetical protein X801_03367 [Opisthorchis viverrini]